jgi:hypothetical protein
MFKTKRDFVDRGGAIVQRYNRCAPFWRAHLDLTASFINDYAPISSSVAVLGAGRLLDIDLLHLLERCQEVHLFDADSAAVARWKSVSGKSYGRRVFGHVLDLTECLDAWSKGLAAAVRADRLSEYLDRCHAPIPCWGGFRFDGFISLNILGQIPLYWRDRVLAQAKVLSDREWAALSASMERLQVGHLRGLSARSDSWVIMVTDTEYYFYQSDKSDWRVEGALFAEAKTVCDEFFGSSVSDTWLWHIAPQFIESDDEGEIHRVEAAFRRCTAR